MPSPTQEIGARAEERAETHLVAHNYEIIERNWLRQDSEIDRIAWHEGALVFIEIRYRKNDAHGDPMETVDFEKQTRIVRGAVAYVQSLPVTALPAIRFDVVSVLESSVTIIKDAFEISESGSNRMLWML